MEGRGTDGFRSKFFGDLPILYALGGTVLKLTFVAHNDLMEEGVFSRSHSGRCKE
jgi:hypothetical protein